MQNPWPCSINELSRHAATMLVGYGRKCFAYPAHDQLQYITFKNLLFCKTSSRLFVPQILSIICHVIVKSPRIHKKSESRLFAGALRCKSEPDWRHRSCTAGRPSRCQEHIQAAASKFFLDRLWRLFLVEAHAKACSTHWRLCQSRPSQFLVSNPITLALQMYRYC